MKDVGKKLSVVGGSIFTGLKGVKVPARDKSTQLFGRDTSKGDPTFVRSNAPTSGTGPGPGPRYS